MLILFLFIYFLPLHHFRIFFFVSDTCWLLFPSLFFFFLAHNIRPVSLGKNVGNEGSHLFFFFLSVKFYEKNFCPLCKPVPTEWSLFYYFFLIPFCLFTKFLKYTQLFFFSFLFLFCLFQLYTAGWYLLAKIYLWITGLLFHLFPLVFLFYLLVPWVL